MKKTAIFTLFMLLTLTATAQKYVGGDISLLPSYEQNGAKYQTSGGTAITDMLAFYQQQGWNAMRVRLFVDPSKASTAHKGQGVRQDLDYVTALAKRIKAAGFALLLDFHYSDTWTDPGQHSTPAAWNTNDPATLANYVYTYTRDCLNTLVANGATPDFVQPGNEITYGMLWPTGHCYPNGTGYDGGTFDNFARYLQSGIKAIREVCPKAKVVIQTELSRSSNIATFYTQLKNRSIDYDVIGLSYYPHYHGTLATLNNLLTTLEGTFADKKIQIVETGYFHKWYPDDATYKISSFPNWPATDEGQRQFAADLVNTLNSHSNVDGLYWWFPEANEYGLNWSTQRVTDSWYNASLFDNETGRALPATAELRQFITGEQAGIESIAREPAGNAKAWHTTDGRVVAQPSQPGIYIHGRQKVIVK